MAEKLFTKALKFNSNGNVIEIDEKKIYSFGISSARITNACLIAEVKGCERSKSTAVMVKYNSQKPQIIDVIAPEQDNKISINITEELNCLIKFAFRYSGNPEHDDKISVIFDKSLTLGDIDLYAEYVPEQIMHENSAYVDYDVRQAGSGKINLATGALRFNHQCGNEVALVYNDGQTEKRSTAVYDAEGKKTKFRHGVGKGFKLNLEQFLIKRKGTENQSVYTYVDGEGNYHEFSEKYYYTTEGAIGKKHKIYVPKSKVQVDLNGHLKYVIKEHDEKEILIERKTTNGLRLEQDYSGFKGAKYLEQRQQEQIELEENIDALKKQLKNYVIIDKHTGKIVDKGNLKDKFNKNDELSVAAYENFLIALNKSSSKTPLNNALNTIQNNPFLNGTIGGFIGTIGGFIGTIGSNVLNGAISVIDNSRILLTESEAIQYQSLLLQQTVVSDKLTSKLFVNSTYKDTEYYSDEQNIKKNIFKKGEYNKTLIMLRRLVHDLRKDYATLTRKLNYSYTYSPAIYNNPLHAAIDSAISGAINTPLVKNQDHYQYEAYVDYLNRHNYKESESTCCIDINRIKDDYNLNKNIHYLESNKNLTIDIGHIQGKYCDLKLELERINDHLDSYYRNLDTKDAKDTRDMKVRQKVVEQRLRLFQQEFSDRTDKLQANINKFEAEINDFIEQAQGELINRQIVMLLETSENNKADLEKYFKQYYNAKHQLTQMNWQTPTYFITGNGDATMGFNKDGYLVALFDNYENQTAILYEKGRISSVQDTDNNVISFEYDKGKRIKTITTSDGKTFHLFYDKDKKIKKGLLTNIIDGNGEETVLGYDNYGFLNSVKDNNGFGVKFLYDTYGRVREVKRTTEIDFVTDNEVKSISEISETLAAIDYHDSHLTTSVTDQNGLVTTYNFDIVGKVVNMYEGQYSDPEETTRAKSFEYTDGKKSFSVSDIVASENKIQENDRNFVLNATKNNLPCEAIKIIEIDKSQFEKGVTDYVFSLWAKADSAYVESDRSHIYANNAIDKTYGITTDEAKQNRKFEVRAEIKYKGEKDSVSFVAGFDWLNTKWQFITMPIEIKQGKEIESCIIYIDYSYNVGEANFDCLSLKEGSWTYNEFDEEGRQTYSEDSANRTSTKYFYDDNDRLIKEELTDVKGNVFTSTHEYNAQGSPVRSINYAGVVEETVYDDKGRAVKKITYNIDDPTSKFYEESKLDDKGVVTADIDESGEYDGTTYTYDHNGEVAVQTDGKGNKTAFGYKDGNLVSISGSVDSEESINTMHHTAGLLTKVSNGETEYNYEYDGWGRDTRITIAGNDFKITKKYTDNLHSTVTYAEGSPSSFSCLTESDVYGNIVKQTVKYSNGTSAGVTNTYDTETGKLTESAVDNCGKPAYNVKYKYDHKGNIVNETRDGAYPLTKIYKYNSDNTLERSSYTVGGQSLEYTYETDGTPDKRNSNVTLPFGVEQKFGYDGLGRTREISLGEKLVKNISYQKFGDHATNRVSTVWYGVNNVRKDSLKYTYDKAGNIETITENGKVIARYEYDGLNRLTKEKTEHFGEISYEYDSAGNIVRKTVNETDYEYSYSSHGWRDQLLSFNGLECKYDALGNPLSYKGRTLTWQGRRLISYGIENKKATYTYDFNNVRTSKTATDGTTSITSKYIYDGNTLIAEQRNGTWIYYLYGVDGIAGFRYNGVTYLYRKNIQGDITHIYTEDGQQVAHYAYDAFGNTEILSQTDKIGSLNPFRYRGYYFDIETKLYYLISRYYDPETCRFISADSIEYLDPETLGGLNLYAYCGNNPVMAIDPDGTKLKWWQNLLIAIGGIVIIAALAVTTVATGGAAAGLVGAIAVGALKGALIGAAVGAAVGAGIGYAVGGIDGLWTGLAIGFTGGALIGAVIGGAVGGLTYSPLKAASNAAFKARPDKMFNINKHLSGAGGKHSKFISNSVDDIVSMAQKGLKSQNVFFKTNSAAKSWQIIVDM